MKLNKNNAFNLGYTKNFVQNIKIFKRGIKYAYQRITRGYSDYDIWDLDYYISDLLSEMLNHFADTTHSYPCSVDEEVEGGHEKWQDELRQAAKYIKDATEIDYTDELLKRFELYEEAKKNGCDELAQKHFVKWRELGIKEQREKQDALNNFCDWLKLHFFNLWD